MEASFSRGRDVIGWKQSKPSGDSVCEKVIVRQFARANNPVSHTTNTEYNSEINTEAEESKLHRMGKVHDFLEMWQGSQNLCATQ